MENKRLLRKIEVGLLSSFLYSTLFNSSHSFAQNSQSNIGLQDPAISPTSQYFNYKLEDKSSMENILSERLVYNFHKRFNPYLTIRSINLEEIEEIQKIGVNATLSSLKGGLGDTFVMLAKENILPNLNEFGKRVAEIFFELPEKKEVETPLSGNQPAHFQKDKKRWDFHGSVDSNPRFSILYFPDRINTLNLKISIRKGVELTERLELPHNFVFFAGVNYGGINIEESKLRFDLREKFTAYTGLSREIGNNTLDNNHAALNLSLAFSKDKDEKIKDYGNNFSATVSYSLRF